ncbi:MAG: hypothetical protein PVH02_12175 [Desulfobacteraceae bacterium]
MNELIAYYDSEGGVEGKRIISFFHQHLLLDLNPIMGIEACAAGILSNQARLTSAYFACQAIAC